MLTKKEVEEQIKSCEQEIGDLQIQIMTLQEKIGRAKAKLENLKDILHKKEYYQEE